MQYYDTLPSSANARQPPCQAESLSLKLNSSSTDVTTSSANSLGNLPVILPIPLAADHLVKRKEECIVKNINSGKKFNKN